jgi:ParB/RepB/Spo0J family partition protein
MTNATNAAVATAKKAKKVSHAKVDNLNLPLPVLAGPEYGMMATDSIIVLDQVRKEFDPDGLNELAQDIAERGILQPLTVRSTEAGFVLVAGERRLRAAKLAKLASVPVLISEISESGHQLTQLAENIQRADLSLAEEAEAVRLLHDALGTVKAVAEKLHKSMAWTSKRLSLAKGLSSYAHALMADGITEDIELLQCVDKLDRATPGTNSAWALCNAIRAGKAGREEAREALRKATEPKASTSSQPKNEPVNRDPLWESSSFRYWINHDHPWHAPAYLPTLWALVKDEDEMHKLASKTGGKYNGEESGYDWESEQIKEIKEKLEALEAEHKETLKKAIAAVTEKYGDLALHEAWMKHQAEGETE